EQMPVDVPGPVRLRSMISRQTHHLSRLVDDLLDVSRITHGKIELRKEQSDVRTAVRRAVETTRLLVERRSHTLTVDLPAEPLLAEIDPARLEQVMVNLIGNAAKYTDAGGRIWVSAELQESAVVLRVRDTGVGIAPQVLPHVFDLFTQADRSLDRSQGGLGIGLTLVRSLVELHGGTVSAHSEGTGRGSEFIVRLPRAVHPGDYPSSPLRPEPAQSGDPRRILVVEDNPDAAESLVDLLELWGHAVEVAPTGEAALSLTSTYRPDIVLLDIGLPGMDGYQVAERLRQQPAPRPGQIVALTGYGQEADRRRSAEAGFDHHLVKPVDPNELRRLLEQAPAAV
ncbi:MAG TPA: ATP-binding protein, partial [Armatimonadota bacterium]|nr:ATP-binding protein [Armatimonadota bacterium]